MKKLLLILSFALVSPVLFFSCENEIECVEDSYENPDIQEDYTKIEGIQEIISQPTLSTENARCFPATFAVSPCDQSFRVSVTYNGTPLSYNCQYYVFQPGVGVVNTGFVSHNQNTDPVLNYCTNYFIILNDPCTGQWTVLQAVSDGCNNTFVC